MKTRLHFFLPLLLALTYLGAGAAGPPQQKISIAVDPNGISRYMEVDSLGNLLLAGSGLGLIATPPQQLFAVALDPSGNPQYLKVDSGGGLITSGGGGSGNVTAGATLTQFHFVYGNGGTQILPDSGATTDGNGNWTITSLTVTTSSNAAAASSPYSAASPNGTSASITPVSGVTVLHTTAASATVTYTLPAASSYKGYAIEIVVMAGTHHVNFYGGSGVVLYLGATALTAGHYIQDATSAATDFIWVFSDGTNWSAELGSGYSGSWADASSA